MYGVHAGTFARLTQSNLASRPECEISISHIQQTTITTYPCLCHYSPMQILVTRNHQHPHPVIALEISDLHLFLFHFARGWADLWEQCSAIWSRNIALYFQNEDPTRVSWCQAQWCVQEKDCTQNLHGQCALQSLLSAEASFAPVDLFGTCAIEALVQASAASCKVSGWNSLSWKARANAKLSGACENGGQRGSSVPSFWPSETRSWGCHHGPGYASAFLCPKSLVFWLS